jgi:uncharacterized membrane protein YeaQ/YmgE (transglycosylase-associated protein family)
MCASSHSGIELALVPQRNHRRNEMGILLFIVFGLVVGLVARALMPGRQSMGLAMTAILGMVGSFIGGFLGNLISSRPAFDITTAGFIGSIVGALLVMVAVGAMGSGRRFVT